MDKEKLSYDLAMIYSKTAFQDYFKHLPANAKMDHDYLTNELYILFEESYISFLLMEKKRFDFSDIYSLDAE